MKRRITFIILFPTLLFAAMVTWLVFSPGKPVVIQAVQVQASDNNDQVRVSFEAVNRSANFVHVHLRIDLGWFEKFRLTVSNFREKTFETKDVQEVDFVLAANETLTKIVIFNINTSDWSQIPEVYITVDEVTAL